MTEGIARLRAFLESGPGGALDAEVTTELYRVLAENSAAFVTLADANGILRWASPSATQLLGWTVDGAVGRATIEFLHPDDIPTLVALRQRMTKEEALTICCRVLAADGSYRWFDLAIKPVFDADGTLVARVTAYQDVQARVEAEEALAASERQFRLLAENATDVILHVRGTTVAWVSPSLSEAVGWAPADWVGADVLAFVHPDDVEAARPVSVMQSAHPVRMRLRLRTSDGGYRWVESITRAHADAHGMPDGWISSFRVIDDMVRAETELDRRARFDNLTGLVNRTEALTRMERMASHLPRTGSMTALLFCDIDRFKDVNDTFGHAAGDEVLRAIGERLHAAIRADDLAARIGGDELLVLLSGVHSLDEAQGIAEKLRLSAQVPIRFGAEDLRVSLSIGVTLAQEGESADALIARADQAMYRAKTEGRNRVVVL